MLSTPKDWFALVYLFAQYSRANLNVNARLRLPVPTREHDFNEDEYMVYTNCSSPVLSSCQGTL
jgi:hypothetical protein